MAKLTIERSSEWINKLRDIGIYLDGEKLGVIANGEIKSFDIPSGQHTIYSKIDWVTSRELTFKIDEQQGKTFVLRSYANGSFWKTLLVVYYLAAKKNDFIMMESCLYNDSFIVVMIGWTQHVTFRCDLNRLV